MSRHGDYEHDCDENCPVGQEATGGKGMSIDKERLDIFIKTAEILDLKERLLAEIVCWLKTKMIQEVYTFKRGSPSDIYFPEGSILFLNGVLQISGMDYTVSRSSATFQGSLKNNDVVSVVREDNENCTR